MENPEYYDLMFIQRAPMKKLKEMGCDWENGDAALTRLKATVSECMEKGLIAKTDPDLVSMSIWSMVHGLVALAIRTRLDNFLPKGPHPLPIINHSWDCLTGPLTLVVP